MKGAVLSADNGIYILVTKGQGGGREYRVTYAQAIENVELDADYPPNPGQEALNREWTMYHFGGSEVLTDRGNALQLAGDIYDDVMEGFGILEYGISFLDYSWLHFPSMRPRRNRRRRQRRQELAKS